MSGWEKLFSFLRLFFPPDLSPAYLRAALVPVLETLQMAVGALLLAALAGLALSLAIGARLPGARWLYRLLVALRCIPDLTLAIFCVIVVGLGPSAGLLALAIFYTAAMGKIFSDLFASADPKPVEALQSTGATRLMVAFYGLLPLRLKDLLTYGAYEFESVIRSSVIVGAVAAGGLATELTGALNNTDYRRATTLILMLVVLVALADRLAWFLRRHPRFLLVWVAAGAAAAWISRPHMLALAHFFSVFWAMLPPRLPPAALAQLPKLIGQTLLIALGGTLMAMICAVPLGIAAARNLSPAFIRIPARRSLEILRSVPEVIWGLILVAAALDQVWLGVLALGLHSSGTLGKLYAESIENVPAAPVMAVRATGASRLAVAAFAMAPLAFAPMAVHSLFRLEWNMRASTVVGMIGAAGIGQALYNAQQLMFYNQMLAYIAVTWAMIMMTDMLNTRLRKRWRIG